MSSTERFRELVNERMMVAAEEIFGVFKTILLESEEEMRRQRGLLDALLKPVVKLQRIELPQQRVRTNEEILKSPQIKVELQGLCTGQEGPQLETKAHSETIVLTHAHEENGHGGDVKLWFNPDESQSEAERPASICISMIKSEADQENSGVPEPKSDPQLPCNNPDIAESTTRTGEYGDSEPPQALEGLCVGPEDKQSELEQEGDTLTFTCGDGKEEPMCTFPDETSGAGEEESLVNMPVESSVLQEPKNDHQLPSNKKKRSLEKALGSTRDTVPKEKKEHSKKHCESKCESPVSSIQHKIDKDQPLIKCAMCPEYFKHKESLKHHMKIHGTGKPLYCETCGRGFLKKAAYINHLKTHRGKKMSICEVCGKEFYLISRLRNHLRRHLMDWQHVCLICNRGCFTNSELKRHMLTHTDVRPFTCKTCGNGFKRKFHLSRHQKTHKA